MPCSTSSLSSSTLPQTLLDTKNSLIDKIKIEKFVENNDKINKDSLINGNDLKEQKPPCSISTEMKRSSATIGIATVHRNGLIQSPMVLNNSALLRQQQPPNKMTKLDQDDSNK